MKKQRITLMVSVELDPTPGAFHTPEQAAESVAAILTGRIPHYDPQVSIPEDEGRKHFELAEGQMLQVNVTDEGVIFDAFDGDEHVGTRGMMADEWFDAIAEARVEPPPRQHQACEYVHDGNDTDGTEWFRCTVHDELASGDEAPCAGYHPEPYTHTPSQAERLSAAKIALLALIDRTINPWFEGEHAFSTRSRVVEKDWTWGHYVAGEWYETDPAPLAILWEEGPDDWTLQVLGEHPEQVRLIEDEYGVQFDAITSWAMGIFGGHKS